MSENTVTEEAARPSRWFGWLAKVRAKTWGYLLLAVVVLVFLWQNWAPFINIDFLIFGPFSIPFPILAIFFVLVGFLLSYLLRHRHGI